MIWRATAAITIIGGVTLYAACLFSGIWVQLALFYHPLATIIWWGFMATIATPIALLAYVLYDDK